jgi:hypothetical protein
MRRTHNHTLHGWPPNSQVIMMGITKQERQNKERISATDTAKLIRQLLREEYPEMGTYGFSVKTDKYSGGSSIKVRWNDGPTKGEVEDMVSIYSGSGFNGMKDLKYYRQAWRLPDGSFELARVSESAYNGGYETTIRPHDDAELVQFSADFVFCSRQLTREPYQRLIDVVCDHFDDWAGDETVTQEQREAIKLETTDHANDEVVKLDYSDDETVDVLRGIFPPWSRSHNMNLGQEIGRHVEHFPIEGDYCPSDH